MGKCCFCLITEWLSNLDTLQWSKDCLNRSMIYCKLLVVSNIYIFYIFTPTWGRFPFWLIFFRWVETTNQITLFNLLNLSHPLFCIRPLFAVELRKPPAPLSVRSSAKRSQALQTVGWLLVYLFQCLIHPLNPIGNAVISHTTGSAYISARFFGSAHDPQALHSFNHLRCSHAKLLLFDSWFLNVETSFWLLPFAAWHHRHQIGFGSG